MWHVMVVQPEINFSEKDIAEKKKRIENSL